MSKRVAILGDSQAQGVSMQFLPVALAAGLEVVSVDVQPGIGTARAESSGLLDGAPVDVAIVLLGGNDAVAELHPDRYEAELVRAVGKLRVRAQRIVWIGPMASTVAQVDRKHAAAAEVQRRVLPRLGVAWLSGRLLSRGLEHGPDGVHFKATAYRAMALAIVDLLAPRNGIVIAIGTTAIALACLSLAALGAELLAAD